MKQRQGGFLISKIKQIGGRKFDKILQEKNIDAFQRRAGKNFVCTLAGRENDGDGDF